MISPATMDKASLVATLHANSASPYQGCPRPAAAAQPSNPNGRLKLSDVPKWPLGREKRVERIQRTWCFIDCRKLELITMWSMVWGKSVEDRKSTRLNSSHL